MSSLIVEVCNVDAVNQHPNADRLEVVTVKGWQVVSQKGRWKANDRCVYLPPDVLLPRVLSDRLEITKYLKGFDKRYYDSSKYAGRVGVARLRSLPSYGVVFTPDKDWPVGQDVADHYEIIKWEPPQECQDGDAAAPVPAFHTYYSFENYRNFPDLIPVGTEVVLTEKAHGMNARLGLIKSTGHDGNLVGEFMAGSHGVRRKLVQGRVSRFWQVMTEPIQELLMDLAGLRGDAGIQHNVILFGEIFGSGVQDLWYGRKNGQFDFVAFDITVDGKYLDYDAKITALDKYEIHRVPEIYRGPFSKEIVEKYVSGKTLLGGDHFREGVVITPVVERPVQTEKKFFDRSVLKAISFEYLERKSGTENH